MVSLPSMDRTSWSFVSMKSVPTVVSTTFFFFSSRRRHTRCSRDWSSDVCSSDLCGGGTTSSGYGDPKVVGKFGFARSEERRVGKSVDLGGRRIIKKKNIGRDILEDVVLTYQ